MRRFALVLSLCCCGLLRQSYAQEVFVARDANAQRPIKQAQPGKINFPKAIALKEQTAKAESPATPPSKASPETAPSIVIQPAKAAPVKAEVSKPRSPPNVGPRKGPESIAKPVVAQQAPAQVPAKIAKVPPAAAPPTKSAAVAKAPPLVVAKPVVTQPAASQPPVTSATQTSPIIAEVKKSDTPVATAPKAVPPPAAAPRKPETAAAQSVKAPAVVVAKPAVTQPAASQSPVTSTTQAPPMIADVKKSETAVATPPKAPPVKVTALDAGRPPSKLPSTAQSTVAQVRKPETAGAQAKAESASTQNVNLHMETAFTKLADGFDFPIGKPDAQGYYKARGFRSRGHLGEDWDGTGGGDTDLGDSIYSIGDGVVVFARDCHMGWGNVIIVRHSYREGGTIKTIDALYGHLNHMLVRRGQSIARGQKIGSMGTAHGLYDAHLHLEIRKNISIGMSRDAFARDFSNYHDPSQFIASHRRLQTGTGTYRIAMNTFVRDRGINFDKARNYSKSRHRGGTSESAAALKKAVAAKRR